MPSIKWKPLIISLLISLGTGFLAGLLTMNSMDIYQKLPKPPLAPPSIVFPIVWTILYILMGIAAYLVYTTPADPAKKQQALTEYGLQLFVNFLWPLLFFNLNAFFLAFICLVLLWYLILQTIILFRKINVTAAYLMIPYLIWVTFAGYLNFAILIISQAS